MPNSTMVIEFLLTRFSDVWKLRVLHAMLFLLRCLATLMGNFLIGRVTTLNQRLYNPIYSFLRNLSFLDMCYISVTVPKACVIFLLNRAISKAGCAAQIFLVFLLSYIEWLFLSITALDCYVAICLPLQYPVTMNPPVCVQMTMATLISGLAYSGFHTGNTFRLPFCQSDVVHQFFCDVPSLLELSCSDTLSNEILILVSEVLVVGGCFAFIIMSYSHIFSTVLRFPASGEQGKAFSTCVPHNIFVVTAFGSSASAVYVEPTSSSPTIQSMITCVFYSIVPPFFNPIIYILRNKQTRRL